MPFYKNFDAFYKTVGIYIGVIQIRKSDLGGKIMKYLKYCPELNHITGSITASLLMCQLEYWFQKKDYKPFYKFLEPCSFEHYHKGDSWTEELGFTKVEFRSAFRRIGKVYKSKTEYKQSKDKFEEKLYLSYYDRMRKLTYYMRNDPLIHTLLGDKDCVLPYSKEYPSSKIIPKDKECLSIASPAPYHKIIDLFHKCCPSLKSVLTLTTACKHQIDRLWQKLYAKGKDAFALLESAFTKVEHSDFLCGRMQKGSFKAAFGWIIRPDKFFAILEDAYAPFVSSSKPSPSSTFMHMYVHGFNIKELEAREQAYLESHYDLS